MASNLIAMNKFRLTEVGFLIGFSAFFLNYVQFIDMIFNITIFNAK